MRKVVCLLSGGLDSTVLATQLRNDGREVLALSIHYGQRHARELRAAARVAEELGIAWDEVEAGALNVLLGGSSLTDDSVAVPHGHYADETMKATVVPNRNMLLLAMAGALAVSAGADAIAYAAHAGDHAIYPDCRPAFMDAVRQVLALANWTPIGLETPFADWTKAQIVQRGVELRAPLGLTYSCYEGQATHCGRCGTCVERREAFTLAGVADPTTYA
jgi:7-cyano-7-deazaguanine synthase